MAEACEGHRAERGGRCEHRGGGEAALGAGVRSSSWSRLSVQQTTSGGGYIMSSAVSGAAEAGSAVAPAVVQSRVFFQSPPLSSTPPPGPLEEEDEEDPSLAAAAAAHRQQQQRRQQQGKVTVKYDRKELRKRLVLEEWIVEQLSALYGCEEEEMPEVEIDIDDLLDANSEEERVFKLQESLVDCYKPTEEFVKELLNRIRGMRKLSPPQKKAT